MQIVDASAIVKALLTSASAEPELYEDTLAAPHLIDSEVLGALRGLVLSAQVTATRARGAIGDFLGLEIERFGLAGLHHRVWELRANVSAYDATYVALAELHEVPLLTGDARLSRATGPRCTIRLI